MDDETREQASPEVQARIRASFERQGLMRHLGAHTAHIAPGRVHVVLPSRPQVTQQAPAASPPPTNPAPEPATAGESHAWPTSLVHRLPRWSLGMPRCPPSPGSKGRADRPARHSGGMHHDRGRRQLRRQPHRRPPSYGTPRRDRRLFVMKRGECSGRGYRWGGRRPDRVRAATQSRRSSPAPPASWAAPTG